MLFSILVVTCSSEVRNVRTVVLSLRQLNSIGIGSSFALCRSILIIVEEFKYAFGLFIIAVFEIGRRFIVIFGLLQFYALD